MPVLNQEILINPELSHPHKVILAKPLLSKHLSEASNFGLSLDHLLKTGDCIINHLNFIVSIRMDESIICFDALHPS